MKKSIFSIKGKRQSAVNIKLVKISAIEGNMIVNDLIKSFMIIS